MTVRQRLILTIALFAVAAFGNIFLGFVRYNLGWYWLSGLYFFFGGVFSFVVALKVRQFRKECA